MKIKNNIVIGDLVPRVTAAINGLPEKIRPTTEMSIYNSVDSAPVRPLTDPGWMGFLRSSISHTILWYDGSGYLGRYLWAHIRWQPSITIIVHDKDTTEDLTLRVWHELLHYHDLPADDMVKNKKEFLTGFDLWVFPVAWYLYKAYYERKYYEFLTGLI